MSAEQTPDIETLAARLFLADPNRPSPGPWVSLHESGQLPYLSMAQAATDVFAPVLAAAVREAEQRALREAAYELPGGMSSNGARDWLRGRAVRITEPVSHEAATSGEEASKA